MWAIGSRFFDALSLVSLMSWSIAWCLVAVACDLMHPCCCYFWGDVGGTQDFVRLGA